jgi:hypothetical protein
MFTFALNMASRYAPVFAVYLVAVVLKDSPVKIEYPGMAQRGKVDGFRHG